MHNDTTAPHRFDFSHTELVGHLDMVGEVMCQIMNGQPLPLEVAAATLHILRSVRDDLAARGNLPTAPVFRTPAYLAECEIRNMTEDGVFDRNTPFDHEGA
jgi:hypothetical protein